MQDSGFQVLLQGNNFLRILQGLGVTIGISIVSVLLSLLLGTLFGIVMTSKSKIVRFLSRIYLEFIRIMPQLVLLFIVYFGLARNFNINISGELSAIIVFTLWGTAETVSYTHLDVYKRQLLLGIKQMNYGTIIYYPIITSIVMYLFVFITKSWFDVKNKAN